jgi:aryl-alcohol dehydrogenase-like predicted oxidoreductase
MERRKIGALDVSVVGIGCNNFGWRIDAAATKAVVDAALGAGINFFDTADVYGAGQSEEYLGTALKGRREQAVIATKFSIKMGEGMEGAKPEYVRRALEASLRRLGVGTIDLYQLHKPDAATPIGDTLAALDEAVKAGQVREIGCSNFSAAQLREARAAVQGGAAKFVSVQNEYILVHRDPENEVLPECARQGLAFLPYFPLANGLLTGKYRRGQAFPESSRGKDGFGPKVFTEENLATVESLMDFAKQWGHTLLELAFSWLAARGEVASVIAGAKTAVQVQANAKAAEWKLSAGDLEEIDKILAAG